MVCAGNGSKNESAATELTGPGTIKLSGGCEAYSQATIELEPAGDGIRLRLDNPLGHFPDMPKKMDAMLDRPAVSRHLAGLIAALESKEPGPATTRGEVLELDLELNQGRLKAEVKEWDQVPAMDPLLEQVRNLLALAMQG